MKRFGKFRDPRFALTTLQNPTWEVRTRAELIQAVQPAIERQPDAPEILATPTFAQPQIATNEPTADLAIPGNANLLIGVSVQQPQSDPDLEPELEPQLQLQPHPIASTPPEEAPATQPLPQVVATLPAKRNRKYKPRPKRRPKSGSFFKLISGEDAAEFVAEALDRHADNAAGPHRNEPFSLPDLERHSRKCDICHHPDRAGIEEDFVNWRNADLIRTDYKIPNYRTVYRHARALRLYELRRQNLRFAAELLIEHADQAKPDPNVILRAIHACARITDCGEWVEPVRRVIMTSGDRQPASAPSTQPAPELELPQPVPETSPHAQSLISVSNAIEADPPFLIDNPAIRK